MAKLNGFKQGMQCGKHISQRLQLEAFIAGANNMPELKRPILVVSIWRGEWEQHEQSIGESERIDPWRGSQEFRDKVEYESRQRYLQMIRQDNAGTQFTIVLRFNYDGSIVEEVNHYMRDGTVDSTNNPATEYQPPTSESLLVDVKVIAKSIWDNLLKSIQRRKNQEQARDRLDRIELEDEDESSIESTDGRDQTSRGPKEESRRTP